jgi:putative oxidoreductase
MTTRSPLSTDAGSLVARLALGALFVPAGYGKIAGFAGTAGYIASQGVPLPQVAAALAVAIELGLGLMLVAGLRTRWAALGLAAFVVAITPIFHAFWSLPPAQAGMQAIMFWKNVGIVGGLLLLATTGGGRWSVDGLQSGAPRRAVPA